QAEDGIRAFHVTGVQTCALPISALSRTKESQVEVLSPRPRGPASDQQGQRPVSHSGRIASRPTSSLGAHFSRGREVPKWGASAQRPVSSVITGASVSAWTEPTTK